ncbi:Uncharacterised protein [Achromobacter sp. 2789STDY5608615]|nr:Uncharacterised protein [Achromobacter sp. 2789STDY5608615]
MVCIWNVCYRRQGGGRNPPTRRARPRPAPRGGAVRFPGGRAGQAAWGGGTFLEQVHGVQLAVARRVDRARVVFAGRALGGDGHHHELGEVLGRAGLGVVRREVAVGLGGGAPGLHVDAGVVGVAVGQFVQHGVVDHRLVARHAVERDAREHRLAHRVRLARRVGPGRALHHLCVEARDAVFQRHALGQADLQVAALQHRLGGDAQALGDLLGLWLRFLGQAFGEFLRPALHQVAGPERIARFQHHRHALAGGPGFVHDALVVARPRQVGGRLVGRRAGQLHRRALGVEHGLGELECVLHLGAFHRRVLGRHGFDRGQRRRRAGLQGLGRVVHARAATTAAAMFELVELLAGDQRGAAGGLHAFQRRAAVGADALHAFDDGVLARALGAGDAVADARHGLAEDLHGFIPGHHHAAMRRAVTLAYYGSLRHGRPSLPDEG